MWHQPQSTPSSSTVGRWQRLKDRECFHLQAWQSESILETDKPPPPPPTHQPPPPHLTPLSPSSLIMLTQVIQVCVCVRLHPPDVPLQFITEGWLIGEACLTPRCLSEEVLAGTEVRPRTWEKRGTVRSLTLHCYHLNDSCIQRGSDDSHLNVSLNVRGKTPKTLSTDHNF